MKLHQVTINDLENLVEISKKTFIAAFAHLNDPADFALHVEAAFLPETLKNELSTEGVFFYFLQNEGVTYGYFKLNVFKTPSETHVPNIFEVVNFEKNKTIELERIYVDTEFIAKGIGQILMDNIFDLAKNTFYCNCIWLGVWEHNPRAIKFYERMGFTKFGDHIFTIGIDDQTDFLMLKRI